MVIIKSTNIIKKFNKNFKEMSEYYNLSHMPLYTGVFHTLKVINISDLADIINISLPNYETKTLILFIHSNYPGLTPFYKLYLAHYDKEFDIHACQIYLQQINESIKIIRKIKAMAS